MVAMPVLIAVTKPFWSTVAIESSSLSHSTFLLVALEGEMMVVNFNVLLGAAVEKIGNVEPGGIAVVPLRDSSTPVTSIFGSTVTLQVPVIPLPSAAVAVMIAVPGITAVTVPLDDTVATPAGVLVIDQVTFLFVASIGNTFTFRLADSPSISVVSAGITVISSTETVFGFTVTSQNAIFPPSWVEATMVVLPAFNASTIPVLPTIATAGSLLLQFMVGLVALEGDTAAINCSDFPSSNISSGLFSVMLFTGTITVTTQVAVLPPSCVVAVIVAVPGMRAETTPLAVTVATLLLVLVQFTVLLVASAGQMVATNVPLLTTLHVSQTFNVIVLSLSDTPSTEIVDELTMTMQVADFPSCVVAVMDVAPSDMAVTVPLLFTVAIVTSLLAHVTVLSVALAGKTVAVSVCGALPSTIDNVFVFSVIPDTGTFTVMTNVAVWLLPSSVVAVMVAVPADTPVIMPLFTVAIALLLLVQLRVWSVASSGNMVAFKCNTPLTSNVAVV